MLGPFFELSSRASLSVISCIGLSCTGLDCLNFPHHLLRLLMVGVSSYRSPSLFHPSSSILLLFNAILCAAETIKNIPKRIFCTLPFPERTLNALKLTVFHQQLSILYVRYELSIMILHSKMLQRTIFVHFIEMIISLILPPKALQCPQSIYLLHQRAGQYTAPDLYTSRRISTAATILPSALSRNNRDQEQS